MKIGDFMDVTVVVAPRERHSSVLETLVELFATVPSSVPIIVVEGGAPRWIRQRLRRLQSRRSFEWVHHKLPLVPNQARNLGARLSRSEFIVFLDNDMTLEPGWLEHLVRNAIENSAGVVAPLICIGPPRKAIIHHAGGVLDLGVKSGSVTISEKHRLMNVPIEEFDEAKAPLANQVAEFHCVLVRKALFDQIGPLDERLVTREQVDFAIRCLAVGATITFEKDSLVTYHARERFRFDDLEYHLFRWAEPFVEHSLTAFETSWAIKLDRDRIRDGWIRNHRKKAIYSAMPRVFSRFPGRLKDRIIEFFERRQDRKVAAVMGSLKAAPKPGMTAEEILSRGGSNS